MNASDSISLRDALADGSSPLGYFIKQRIAYENQRIEFAFWLMDAWEERFYAGKFTGCKC
jgi:hypothetical protein